MIACTRANRNMRSGPRQSIPGCAGSTWRQTYHAGVRHMNNELELCSLTRETLRMLATKLRSISKGRLSATSSSTDRLRGSLAFKSQLGVQRGDRIAILSLSTPNFLGMQWSMRKHRPILSRSRTAPNRASLSASPRHSKFSIVASRSLPDRVQMPGGRGCRGS